MYLAVTRTVRRRSDDGAFENPARMERFITTFADRYLDAPTTRGGRGSRRPMRGRLAFDATTARGVRSSSSTCCSA